MQVISGWKVLKPGAYSTLQDGGRWGLQRYGVSPGGVMDSVAYRIANWLVGNQGDEPALELTMDGPVLLFDSAARIAIYGADMRPRIAETALPLGRPVDVAAGAVLSFGVAISGWRAYLAVAGGFELPRLLGGYGAYPAAGLPGLAGRRLEAGDVLPIRTVCEYKGPPEVGFQAPRWSVPRLTVPVKDEALIVRVVAGPEFDRLTHASQQMLFQEPYIIGSESNRMGYRLKGPVLQCDGAGEMISEGVTFGTVQLPGSGEPIILMADRQTTGGYPRILQVIGADLPLLAQAGPGMRIMFQRVSISEAVHALGTQQQELRMLQAAIRLKLADEATNRQAVADG